MSTAVWLLSYGLTAQSRDDYLGWFHDVHVPEKLARPGYTWAAHYQIIGGDVSPVTEALIEYDRDQLRGDMEQ